MFENTSTAIQPLCNYLGFILMNEDWKVLQLIEPKFTNRY